MPRTGVRNRQASASFCVTTLKSLTQQDLFRRSKVSADLSLKMTCTNVAGSDGELPELLKVLDPNILELVCNEVLDTRPGVSWDDIAGQDDAKSLIQELVVWPMLNPHLFTVSPAPTCILYIVHMHKTLCKSKVTARLVQRPVSLASFCDMLY